MRFKAEFEGVVPNLERRLKEAQTEYAREKLESYMSLVACPHCHGTRYKPEVLAVRVADRNIADVSNLTVVDARGFFGALELPGAAGDVARPILREVNARFGFLEDVGLDYLSLDRSANTLSGGEAQRIRLATQVGSGLTGVLYVLDEPSIGLHPRDNARLLRTLLSLRDLGNTLIVVEHDEETMRAADYIVDLGPGAGVHGGEVVAAGAPDQLVQHPTSLTARYLRGELKIEVPTERRPGNGKALKVVGAREHNLRDVTVEIPLGTLTCVTGASGSGKSTLVHGIIHAALAKELYRAKATPGAHAKLLGTEHVDKVIEIDQTPIGRTPRSNPATYTGIFTDVRDLFTRAPGVAQARLQAGPLLVQRQGRALRGLQRRRDRQGRDVLPPRRLRPVRGLQGRALQPRDARGQDPRQVDRRRAQHDGRRGPRLLREHPDGRAQAAVDEGRRPRLRAHRPALTRRSRAARPSGSSSPASSASAPPVARSTSSTSRPPGCTSTTRASCSTCFTVWWTRATRCS